MNTPDLVAFARESAEPLTSRTNHEVATWCRPLRRSAVSSRRGCRSVPANDLTEPHRHAGSALGEASSSRKDEVAAGRRQGGLDRLMRAEEGGSVIPGISAGSFPRCSKEFRRRAASRTPTASPITDQCQTGGAKAVCASVLALTGNAKGDSRRVDPPLGHPATVWRRRSSWTRTILRQVRNGGLSPNVMEGRQ